MNVLQILPSLVAGGAERGTIDIAAALVKSGHNAFVISAGGRMVPELVATGAHHETWNVASKNPFDILLNAAKLKLFIRQHRIDVIHARSRAPAWSAYFAAKACGIPFVTTFHAAYKGTSAIKKLYNGVMARGTRVIAISRFIADHIHKNYGVTGDVIARIPRGIDFSKFAQEAVSEDRRAKIRAELNLPDRPLLIMPGRITPIKGQGLVLEALAALPTRDFMCLIIGPDQGREDYRAELEQKARDLGLSDVVKFVPQTDLLAAYAMADVVLSPSQVAEGFGRVPVEAQAFGVPVIATALGATDETVLDGETGWLVPAGDAPALTRAITRALGMGAEEKQRMRAKAVAHVRAHFGMDAMCASTLLVYAGLARK